jgi:hypothetical protein
MARSLVFRARIPEPDDQFNLLRHDGILLRKGRP